MGEHITLTAEDGVTIGAYVAKPAGAPRGGIVVIQEIFGVNHHIRAVADRYAARQRTLNATLLLGSAAGDAAEHSVGSKHRRTTVHPSRV